MKKVNFNEFGPEGALPAWKACVVGSGTTAEVISSAFSYLVRLYCPLVLSNEFL